MRNKFINYVPYLAIGVFLLFVFGILFLNNLFYLAYLFIIVFLTVLFFGGIGIYRRAFKSEPRSIYGMIFFTVYILFFIIPSLYFSGYIIQLGFSDYETKLDYKSVRFGYINKSGQTIIPFQYDEAAPFENGYALVKKGIDSFWID